MINHNVVYFQAVIKYVGVWLGIWIISI